MRYGLGGFVLPSPSHLDSFWQTYNQTKKPSALGAGGFLIRGDIPALYVIPCLVARVNLLLHPTVIILPLVEISGKEAYYDIPGKTIPV